MLVCFFILILLVVLKKMFILLFYFFSCSMLFKILFGLFVIVWLGCSCDLCNHVTP